MRCMSDTVLEMQRIDYSKCFNYNTSKYSVVMAIRALVIILCSQLILNVASIAFVSEIPGLERLCFYEVLGQSQKYSIELFPKNQPKFQLEIAESRGGTWTNVYYKMTSIGYEKIEVHKLANSATTYSFCIKNIEHGLLRLSIKFQTGVELMEFELLPDKSDTQNLDRQITWIENQKKNLYETIRQVEQRKSANIDSSSLLSTKMIVFAVIGLVSIAVVNYLFFKEVKKTFKERKLM